MSSAAPGRASSATVWSMPPVGAPATSVSARMQACTHANRAASSSGRPTTAAIATATEHSSAADDERPAPRGTVPSTHTSSPGTSTPDSRRAQATPATYAAQPVTSPGPMPTPSQPSSACALRTRTSRSGRGATAAYVAWGSATGRQVPAL